MFWGWFFYVDKLKKLGDKFKTIEPVKAAIYPYQFD